MKTINSVTKNIPTKKSDGLKPYNFQLEAFAALDKIKVENPLGFSTMLVLPTGAGKTYVSTRWVTREYIDKKIKVLWVAPNNELLEQASKSFHTEATFENLSNIGYYNIGMFSSSHEKSKNIGKLDLDVICTTVQSCTCKRNKKNNIEYYKNWAKGCDRLIIVIDEAHHSVAKTYREVINAMKSTVKTVDVLGLTATPYRTDDAEIGYLKKIFYTDTGIVYSIGLKELIDMGILARPIMIDIPTELNMTEIFSSEEIKRISDTDIDNFSSLLNKFSDNNIRNRIIVDTYINGKDKYGKTIIFAVNINNACILNAMFKKAGIRSGYVSCKKPLIDKNNNRSNEDIIRDFKNNKLDVLINVNMLTEGSDIPDVKTVFITRPTKSKILMSQMVGRGLRGKDAGGTDEAYIVYFIDDWKNKVTFTSPKKLIECTNDVDENRFIFINDPIIQNLVSNSKRTKHYVTDTDYHKKLKDGVDIDTLININMESESDKEKFDKISHYMGRKTAPFTIGQLNEIIDGIKMDLDVSKYAHKCIPEDDMRKMKIAMMNGYEVIDPLEYSDFYAHKDVIITISNCIKNTTIPDLVKRLDIDPIVLMKTIKNNIKEED